MTEPDDLRTAIALIYEQNARGDDLCRVTLNMAVSIIEQAIEKRDKLRATLEKALDHWRVHMERSGTMPTSPQYARITELRKEFGL